MIVTSRSFDEYAACFDLSDARLRGARVLDCAAGAAGFAAVAASRGYDVVAVDPAYADVDAAIAEAAVSIAQDAVTTDAPDDRLSRDRRPLPATRSALRALAFGAFVEDVRLHPHRYLAGALPHLPFSAGAFDLALCSHLLFTWADLLDAPWHAAALRELLRVAAEVRVFPLVAQGSGADVAFLPGLLDDLRAEGVEAQVVTVTVTGGFQVGGDRMLRVSRPR